MILLGIVYVFINIKIFQMLEKSESETENKECLIKVIILKLRLKKFRKSINTFGSLNFEILDQKRPLDMFH